MKPQSNPRPLRTHGPYAALVDTLWGPFSLLRPTDDVLRPLTSERHAKHCLKARESTTIGTTRTPTETKSSLSTMSTITSTSLWTAAEQPILSHLFHIRRRHARRATRTSVRSYLLPSPHAAAVLTPLKCPAHDVPGVVPFAVGGKRGM